MNFDDKIQLITIGDSNVGKTSLLRRYSNKKLEESHLATVGIDNFERDESFKEEIIRVKIWDTAGQERFRALTNSFYKKAQGVILVFDVSSKASFSNCTYWINSLKANYGEDWAEKTILIGNKIDLEREVSAEDAQKGANDYKLPYYEASALDNINVREPIRELASKIKESIVKSKEKENKLLYFIPKSSKCKC